MRRTLPLKDLEAIRRDPRAYRRTMDQGGTGGFGPTIVGALFDAAMLFDASRSNENEVESYLDDRLARFKSVKKKAEALDGLRWYVTETQTLGWPRIQARLPVRIPQLGTQGDEIVCSGRVARVDLVPTGGYAAWLFTGSDGIGWDAELRMPLIQATLAQMFSVPADSVRIGLYAFGSHTVASHSFPDAAIGEANRELVDLIRSMGL